MDENNDVNSAAQTGAAPDQPAAAVPQDPQPVQPAAAQAADAVQPVIAQPDPVVQGADAAATSSDPAQGQAPVQQAAYVATAMQQQGIPDAQPVAGAAPIPAGQPLQAGQPIPAGNPVQPGTPAAQENKGTAVLVLGILSIVFASIIGLVLGCIALAKGKKVLAENPQAGLAKGGRICGVAGIILSVIAIVVQILACVFLLVGIASPSAAVDNYMSFLQKGDGAAASQLSSALDEQLSAYGIDGADELAAWLHQDMSYTIGEVDVQNDVATVHVEVKSHDFEQVSEAFTEASKEIATSDEIKNIKSLDEAYQLIGKKAIEKTKATTELKDKNFDISVEKGSDGTWDLSTTSQADLIYEVYGIY